MQKDYALSLSQRSALLHILVLIYKARNLTLNTEVAWHMTGRITWMKNKVLRDMFDQQRYGEIVDEADRLMKGLEYARR